MKQKLGWNDLVLMDSLDPDELSIWVELGNMWKVFQNLDTDKKVYVQNICNSLLQKLVSAHGLHFVT